MESRFHLRTEPFHLGRDVWLDVFRRALKELGRDNVALIAAGVAFFGLLAVFPALASLVALYRLVGDPADIGAQIGALCGIATGAALDLLHAELLRLMAAPAGGVALQGFVSIMLAFWASQQGLRSFLRGLNIVYGGLARRKLLRRTTMGLGFAGAGLLGAAFAVALLSFAPIGWLRWPLLLCGAMAFALALYRWGPNRRPPPWLWLAPGAALAAALWLAASLLLALYGQTVAGYGQVYGSVAGAVVLLVWLFVTAYAFLLGAEFNAELEAACLKSPP